MSKVFAMSELANGQTWSNGTLSNASSAVHIVRPILSNAVEMERCSVSLERVCDMQNYEIDY